MTQRATRSDFGRELPYRSKIEDSLPGGSPDQGVIQTQGVFSAVEQQISFLAEHGPNTRQPQCDKCHCNPLMILTTADLRLAEY